MPPLLALILVLGPYQASTNFSFDLEGPLDTRPSTYGTAECQTVPMVFYPPSGYRVRILHVSGDVVAWPRTPTPAPTLEGAYAGVLFGLTTTAKDGSVRGNLMADNTMIYRQLGVGKEPVRASFDQKTKYAGLLEKDNILVVKVASWLNTHGKSIHVEPTFTVEYQFELN